MSKNHLYTKSYFCKRIKDSLKNRVTINKNVDVSSFDPSPKWGIDVSEGEKVITIHCFMTPEDAEYHFYDKNGYRITVKTESALVILNQIRNILNDYDGEERLKQLFVS
ncbi:MAG TPA: hypothetical protein PLA71_01065 [Saccharofermentans sp.]|nr:hypothetical protein [Saccharofermentans sp.]